MMFRMEKHLSVHLYSVLIFILTHMINRLMNGMDMIRSDCINITHEIQNDLYFMYNISSF